MGMALLVSICAYGTTYHIMSVLPPVRNPFFLRSITRPSFLQILGLIPVGAVAVSPAQQRVHCKYVIGRFMVVVRLIVESTHGTRWCVLVDVNYSAQAVLGLESQVRNTQASSQENRHEQSNRQAGATRPPARFYPPAKVRDPCPGDDGTADNEGQSSSS